MIKLLFVDDEVNSLNFFCNSIDWSSAGVEVIGKAENGRSAIIRAQQQKPDIILTDIAMPIVDGIELANWISKHNPQCKIIFLTGYWKDEYIKAAFKINVFDYVLKPAGTDEVFSVVSKCAETIRFEKIQQDYLNNLQTYVDAALPFMVERELLLLMQNSDTDVPSCVERLKSYGFSIQENCTFNILLFTSKTDPDKDNAHCNSISQFAARKIVDNVMQDYFSGRSVSINVNEIAYLVQYTPDGSEDNEDKNVKLERSIIETITLVDKSLGCQTVCYTGEWVNGIKDISYSYETASHCREIRPVASSQVIWASRVPKYSDIDAYEITRYCQRIITDIKKVHLSNIEEQINQLFLFLRNNTKVTLFHIRNVCMSLYNVLTEIILEADFSSAIDQNRYHSDLSVILRETDIDMIKSLIIRRFTELYNYMNVKRSGKHMSIINAENIIKSEYQNECSIEKLSSRVFLSTSYFCLLFKQETGYTVNNYLTKVRIDAALMLLKNSDMKINDISRDVGFQDPKYFSKVFKKEVGMSPVMYRSDLSITRNSC